MTEAKYSFTTKVGGDLFTVRGDSVAEFVANLDAAVNAVGSAQNLAAVSTAISGTGPGTTVIAQPAPAPVAAPVAAPAQVTQAGVPTPQCAHGARVHRTGNSARGAWAAWMCPLPKEQKAQQCEPQWVSN